MIDRPSPVNKNKKLTKFRSWYMATFFIVSIGLGLMVSWVTLRGDLDQFNWNLFIETSSEWLANWPMMAMSIFLLLLVILTSGLRLHLLLKNKVKKIRFLDSLYYGILARYYVLITPWGLGGQPILMGVMHQKKVPVGLATSAPMVDLLMMRFAMFVFVTVALVGFGDFVDPLIYVFAWVGFIVTCFIPVVMILASSHHRFRLLLVDVVSWLVPQKSKKNVTQQLTTVLTQYQEAFQWYRHAPIKLISVGFFALISQFALLAMPYFIMASFNLDLNPTIATSFSLLNVVMMMAIANTILGTIPTLGSAGASEFTFATVFSIFMTGNILFWAIFLWRFFLFYLWLIMGLLITFYQGIFYRREARRFGIPKPNLPLKVVLFNDGFYPLIDGVVRAVDAYARYLVSQGVDVTVVVPYSGKVNNFPYKILPIRQIKIPGFFYPIPIGVNRLKYKNALYYEGPIVYHAHTPFLLGHLALKLSKQYHIPLVTTFHSKYYDDYYAATKSKRIANLLKWLTMRYFDQANAVWTVSNAAVNTIRDYGLKKKKIKVFQNGTDLFPNKLTFRYLSQVKNKYKIEKNKQILLFVGQLIWQKNLKLIIDSFEKLIKTGFKGYLCLVGEGRDQVDIQHYVYSKNLQSRVIFTGKITDTNELSAIYLISNLFIFPSLYDTDGIVVKEAAAHELPSILITNSSAASIITDNKDGFIEDGDVEKFAERIKMILNNPKLLNEVSKQAKVNLVKRWNDTLSNLVEEYRRLIDDYYSR
jgi:uncharacterized protein (TIRG00374 family)